MDLSHQTILIVKLRYIGDTLSIVPVVENLARLAPGTAVDVLVNRGTESVLAYHPEIRAVRVYDYGLVKNGGRRSLSYQARLIRDLRSAHYDIVIDYTHGDRAALLCRLTGAPIRITHAHAGTLSKRLMNRFVNSDPKTTHIVDHQLASLRVLGLDGFQRTTSLHVPAVVVHAVDRLVRTAGLPRNRPWVAMHPGARGPLRCWRSERFGEVARRLVERFEAAVLLVGGPGEGELLGEVARHMGVPPAFQSTELSLLETGELLRRCALFIGNDSAPGHLAAAAGCPTVSLFGPTFPHMWRPLSPGGRVVFKNVPCCGCRQETCLRPEASCMDLIGVDEVWERVCALLESDDPERFRRGEFEAGRG
jgi:heptosyltransferase-3